tara:strand:- start:123 stop:395 length:273 start_codon:yes stop_codon:yes gene_type:complete
MDLLAQFEQLQIAAKNMKNHITYIEGSVAALQSRKESLKDIFPLVKAVNAAKRELEEAMAREDGVITDPKTEAANIDREEVEVASKNQNF